jgi:hypothetical protein
MEKSPPRREFPRGCRPVSRQDSASDGLAIPDIGTQLRVQDERLPAPFALLIVRGLGCPLTPVVGFASHTCTARNDLSGDLLQVSADILSATGFSTKAAKNLHNLCDS